MQGEELADMDTADILRVGTELKIIKNSGRETVITPGRIVHSTNETLHLAVPGPKDPRSVFAPGQSVTLSMNPGDEVYVAATQVLRYPKRDPGGLIVARPASLEHIEHREHVRVRTRISLGRCEASFGRSAEWFRMNPTIIDISAGGVLLRHRQLLTEGDTVRMQFTLPDGYGPIKVEGAVLHSWMERHPSRHVYLMGVKFTHMAAQDREAIQRYITKQGGQAGRGARGAVAAGRAGPNHG